jgi:hypothetical protein
MATTFLPSFFLFVVVNEESGKIPTSENSPLFYKKCLQEARSASLKKVNDPPTAR